METILCPLAKAAFQHRDRTALSDGVHHFTFAEANARATKMACALVELGVTAGTRVALLSTLSIESVLFGFALQKLSAVFVPLNSKLTADDWKDQLLRASARFVFMSEKDVLTFEGEGVRVCALESLSEGDRCQEAAELSLGLESEATIIFTSGSSGQSKGVRLSVGNHHYSALASNEVTRLSSEDSWLNFLPLYHVAGLEVFYRACQAGACARLEEKYSPESVLAVLEAEPITHISLVPTMLEELIGFGDGAIHLLSNLKTILLGGAPSSAFLLESIAQLSLPVLTSYGMSETTSHITCLRHQDPPEKISSSGRLVAHSELAILDDSGNYCAPNEIGEIFLRGEKIFLGYLNTADDSRSGEGWFATGDFGLCDEDGFLKVFGRKDRMLISGGENVHCREIEIAAEKLPGVGAVAVVPVPSEKWGQRPVMFVEAGRESDVKASLQKHLEISLSRLKRPDRILVLPRFPRTAIGKVDYRQLEKLATSP